MNGFLAPKTSGMRILNAIESLIDGAPVPNHSTPVKMASLLKTTIPRVS